jgi:hypothetical protein
MALIMLGIIEPIIEGIMPDIMGMPIMGFMAPGIIPAIRSDIMGFIVLIMASLLASDGRRATCVSIDRTADGRPLQRGECREVRFRRQYKSKYCPADRARKWLI